jgi:FlaA1/EpsC-like NDP-sugar epimerase
LDRWDELLAGGDPQALSQVNASDLAGKSVCITGAGGFIGSALAKAVAAAAPRALLLLDHSEQNLYQIDAEISLVAHATSRTAALGDISDGGLLDELLSVAPVDVIFHAAAFKHVPLLEANPFGAVQNNILGTLELARAAAKHGVGKVVMISTDKAVAPCGIMGASKRVAELIVSRYNNEHSCMSSVRFGNVFGSHGSVAPLFRQQIERGGPVTVTDSGASRYFLTLQEAVALVLSAARESRGGEIFVPELGEPLLILELAKRMVQKHQQKTGAEIPIEYIGLRPGDKLKEKLSGEDEILQVTPSANLKKIAPGASFVVSLERWLDEMRRACRVRDLTLALNTLRQIIPDYQPSETVLKWTNLHSVRSTM